MLFLDRNENNYGPAPACFDVLRRADLTTLSWYDRSFARGIRGILSERIARDFELPEERVILGYGAENILKQTVRCYLRPGESLMVPAYSWWYYHRMASEVGGRSIEYPMFRDPDGFRYDLHGMRELHLREQPSILFISSPNNPTGNSLDPEDLDSVLEKVRSSVVVLDEAYTLHTRTGYVRALVEKHPNLLVVRTFSKYFALAGLRIGYGLLGSNLTVLATHMNRYLGYHRLSEEVAIAALDSPEYYREIAGRMQLDKQAYYAELGSLPGWRVYRSDANFVLAQIPTGRSEDLDRYLRGRGIVIKFMGEPNLRDHVRITLGTTQENRLVIDTIKEFFA